MPFKKSKIGDILKKAAATGSGQQDNIDRRQLIDRLKTIKDPRERDRILHSLSRREEIMIKETGPVSAMPPQRESGRAEKPRPAGIPGKISVLNYALPGFFIAMGLLYVLGGLGRLFPGGKFEDVSSELLLGSIFLIFGIIGLIKAGKARKASTG